MDSGKMLDPNYADKLLTQYEEEDIDDSEQYAALREIWDVECSNVNREDQGRKLPPLHPAGNAGHQETRRNIMNGGNFGWLLLRRMKLRKNKTNRITVWGNWMRWNTTNQEWKKCITAANG